MKYKVYCKYEQLKDEMYIGSFDSCAKSISIIRSIFSNDINSDYARIYCSPRQSLSCLSGDRIDNDVSRFNRFVTQAMDYVRSNGLQ